MNPANSADRGVAVAVAVAGSKRSRHAAGIENAGTIAVMPNIASILKAEISRVARKEIRAATDSLKKQSTQYRSQIAALKRQVADLEKLLRKPSRGARAAPAATADEETARTGLRFRSMGFAPEAARFVSGSSGRVARRFGPDDLPLGSRQGQAASKPAPEDRRPEKALTKKGAAAAVAQVMG